MKKGLAISLLVAISLGIGVLGTNIYYNNLLKTQIKQLSTTNKEEKLEDTVEDKKETTTNKDKNSDKESKQVIKNTETKETAKTNTNTSQTTTENKETNKSDSKNKTQQSNNSNEVKNNYNIPEYVVCPGCNMEFKKSDLSKKWNGYCLRCYTKYCKQEEDRHCQYCGVKLNANNQYGEIDMCNYCHYLYCEKPYENNNSGIDPQPTPSKEPGL
jgi:hypothetical protein|nr:hypothetical protein [uncultured Romboutsia sp.]